jgi:DNA ligase (NAD+)
MFSISLKKRNTLSHSFGHKNYSRQKKVTPEVENPKEVISNPENPKEAINALSGLIKKYSASYYNDSVSLISDLEFDQLTRQLDKLEEEHPELASDLASSVGSTTKVPGSLHRKKMLSLANAYDQEDILAFFKRVKVQLNEEKVGFLLELKFDGVAINLQYVKGKLDKALTRGDGIKGEDCSYAISKYASETVPATLKGNFPEFLEIRGEIVIDQKNFDLCNENEEVVYASKRNLASGIIQRKKDSSKENDKPIKLTFFPYGVEMDGGQENNSRWQIGSQIDKLNYIKSLGFQTSEFCKYVSADDIDQIMSYLNDWKTKRINLPYDIDGIVFKANLISHQEVLGASAKYPRWAMAYKFPPLQFSTPLTDVLFQVGRTGKVTPVAVFDPINIDGVVIQKATLHNKNFIQMHNIEIGKSILIERSGDVIPKVIGLAPNQKDKVCETSLLDKFKVCPCSLKHPLTSYTTQVAVFCENKRCPVQVEKKIQHFVSKKALNIEGFGPKTISALLDYEAIRDLSDIFSLRDKYSSLIAIPGLGKKNVDKILDNIDAKKKTVTLPDLLFGLGIPNVGKETAIRLCQKIVSFNEARYMPLQLLQEEIGQSAAYAIEEFMNDEDNQKLLDTILKEIPHLNLSSKKKDNIA